MARCWPHLLHGTARRSFGVPKRGRCKVNQSTVVATAFDIRHLVNFLPSQQPRISTFIIQARGNGSHLSRVTQNPTSHSRGRRMARVFFQEAVTRILQYESGIHRPGSRSVFPGKAILESTPLPLIPLARSSRLQLMTRLSVSGGSQISELSASSSIHPRNFLSLSQWTAGISSAEVQIIRSQSGKYLRAFIQRRVSHS
jgi:hypothetical protein